MMQALHGHEPMPLEGECWGLVLKMEYVEVVMHGKLHPLSSGRKTREARTPREVCGPLGWVAQRRYIRRTVAEWYVTSLPSTRRSSAAVAPLDPVQRAMLTALSTCSQQRSHSGPCFVAVTMKSPERAVRDEVCVVMDELLAGPVTPRKPL
jgi:hypothetical protein